jgi:16S rRNA (uracil1498-N3)-methyltransferase
MALPVYVVAAEALRDDRIVLDGEEGRHASVVARTRVGETVLLTDGLGRGAVCDVVAASKHGLTTEVRERREEPAQQPRLVVVQALPKGDHADRAVDLLTEVGVDVIVPWAAARNVVSWQGERGVKAHSRWQAVARAAAKQSRRLRFPTVASLHDTDQVATLVEAAAQAFVLDETAGPGEPASPPAAGDVVVIVGPEGGITTDERDRFVDRGARLLRLGPTVLRSSTAGVVAASVVLSRTARWR